MNLRPDTNVLQIKQGIQAEEARARAKWIYAKDGAYVVGSGPEEEKILTYMEPPSSNWPPKPLRETMCVYCVSPLWDGRRVRVCKCGHVVHTDCHAFYLGRKKSCRVCNQSLTMFSMSVYAKASE